MSSNTLPPLAKAGDYQLVTKLGEGGMGAVYLGASPTADRVAVKLIKPNLVDAQLQARFAAEVEHLRTVYGPRVARFAGADLTTEPAWLATEYVPGLTLAQHVERRGLLPTPLAAMVGAMLASGLGMVHQAGLLHRDLKPQNVILGPDGPVLIDFGVAALKEREAGLTQPGDLVGTPAYMSPEQAQGSGEVSEPADVYGLGATLAYAVTGRPLYSGVRGWPLVMRISDPNSLPDLSGVAAPLASLLGAMLAFDPSARPTLPVVSRQLLALATAEGEQRARLRQQIIEHTYDESADVRLPVEFTDPVREPEGTPLTEGTAESSPEGTASPQPAQPAPAATEVPVDIDWLVDKLRQQYARRATL